MEKQLKPLEKFTVPIGPQHPALKEPGHFLFSVEGEIVTDAKIRLGYAHRGIEKFAEQRNWVQNQYLVERICGICSHIHATAYCMSVEQLAGVDAPRRAQAIRTLIAELERIHSHFLWVGIAAHEAGFDTLFMYSWRDRETVMDLLEKITGNRVNYSANLLGGVKCDLNAEIEDAIHRSIFDTQDGFPRPPQLGIGDRLKPIDRRCTEPQFRQIQAGPLVPLPPRLARQKRDPFDESSMEQSFCRRHGHQNTDFGAATRLAENQDTPGIPTECGDVVADPFERGNDIQHSGIARLRILLAILGQIQIAQNVESVIESDDDHIAAARQIFAVECGDVVARSGFEPAAMQPDHNRAFLVVIDPRRPDIDTQAVFALKAVVPLEYKRFLVVLPAGSLVLRTNKSVLP